MGLNFLHLDLLQSCKCLTQHIGKTVYPFSSYSRRKSQTHTHFPTSKLGRNSILAVYLDFYVCKTAFQHKFKFWHAIGLPHQKKKKKISYLAVSQKTLLNTAVRLNDKKSENTQLSKNLSEHTLNFIKD